jgi:prepilin-type N-terminal cleavage/methylation domain-containing protein
MSSRTRRNEGYTLMELLVAVLLMAILFPLVADVCRSNGHSLRDVSHRAALVREIGITVASLARDLGRAKSVSAADGELQLQTWDSPLRDSFKEVVYTLDDECRLWRKENGSGLKTIVSSGLEMFSAVQVDSTTVRLELHLKKGGDQRRLVLMGVIP